jgi:hypothetical protein
MIFSTEMLFTVLKSQETKSEKTSDSAYSAASKAGTFASLTNKLAPKVDVQAVSAKDMKTSAAESDLNNYVLKVIPSYEDGKYPYLLNNDYENYNGVTVSITYKDSIIAKANPDGSKSSHCVGLTYEVFYKAMQERNKEAGINPDNFNDMTAEDMKNFLLTWYAALSKPKSEGNQLAGAIVNYGLGTQITRLQDASAGDFIDFSRTKSGHTAVFINWIKDVKSNIVGFKYWSTQESTGGIGYNVEYFSDNAEEAYKGAVNRNQLYIGRVGAMESYKTF